MAAQARLDREFASPAISFLLLDSSGSVLAQRWPEGVETPIPVGSLVKPFLAIAYGEQHGDEFPSVRCQGTKSRCWYPPGHGRLGLKDALAHSCNTYFLHLSESLDRPLATQTLARYGLHGPDAKAANDNLAGLGDGWREAPITLARAYLKLAGDHDNRDEALVREGMMAAASYGTARTLDRSLGANAILAKTGTAACMHRPRTSADGFAVAIYPAAQPRLILLVREDGKTGASTAMTAAAMLRALGVLAP